MTPAPEKAAPIPADVRKLCVRVYDEVANRDERLTIYELMERAVLADRKARPSLPDSREEQIRAEAAEDERDRLYAEACRPVPDNEENETIAALACAAATWLRLTQGVQPTARARDGGNNG